MQLINDFSELQRVAGLLRPEYQQKLIADINGLLLRYMDEQDRPAQAAPPAPSFQPAAFISPPPPPPADPDSALNAIRNSLSRPGTGPLPPPPAATLAPPPTLPPGPPAVTRSLAAGALNLKGPLTPKPQAAKKNTMNIMDCLGFIVPSITDFGQDVLRNPNTPSDTYQFLKNTDGKASLKEIYMFLFPTLAWGKYLEKLYPLARERYISFRRNAGFPPDTEIMIRIGDLLVSMGAIDEAKLEKALEIQKEGPQPAGGANWLDKTKAAMGQVEGQAAKKKMLGDTLVDLGYLTKDQLNYVLTLQKWLRNLIEHI